MRDLLEYIVKSLVTKPDEVEITEANDQNFINFMLKVNPEDIGLVIGKSGQTIKAIRKLLIARSLAEDPNTRINITLQEPQPNVEAK